MARYTTFAGLYALDAGDPVSLNNYEFYNNEDVIDNFINAFVTHRHDGSPAMSGFSSAATLTGSASGGILPPAETYYIGITAVDQYGGETTAQIASAITPGTASNPTIPLTGVAGSSGTLQQGVYRYGYTIFDANGETEISPQINVNVGANGKVTLTLPNTAPNSKRVYRAFGFSDFNKVSDVAGATTTFVDDGTLCTSCDQQPPDENTAGSVNSIYIARPALPASASYWRVYVSTDPGMSSPAALFAYGSASLRNIPSAASAVVFSTEAGIQTGNPPTVSRTIPGASLLFATDVFYAGSTNNIVPSGSVESALDSLEAQIVATSTRVSTMRAAGQASAIWGAITFNASGNLSISQSPASGASGTFLLRVGTTAYGSAGKLGTGIGPTDYYLTNQRDLEYRVTANTGASASAVATIMRRTFNYASGNITLDLSNQQTVFASATSSAAVILVTLPSASASFSGWDYTVKNIGLTNTARVVPSGGQRFEGGSAGIYLGNNEAFTVTYNPSGAASGWWIV